MQKSVGIFLYKRSIMLQLQYPYNHVQEGHCADDVHVCYIRDAAYTRG